MFDRYAARFALRAGIATGLAICAGLATALVDGAISPLEAVAVAGAGLTALGTYVGVGFGVESVEPGVGRKRDDHDPDA